MAQLPESRAPSVVRAGAGFRGSSRVCASSLRRRVAGAPPLNSAINLCRDAILRSSAEARPSQKYYRAT
jgi:hypothetical protein